MSDRANTSRFVDSSDDVLFAQLYQRHLGSIRSYCRRRVTTDRVDDAVAEVFLTAWRRIDDVPAGDDALLWLYRVAYRVIGHEWRSEARRRRLGDRMQSMARPSPLPGTDETSIQADECRLVLEAATRLGGSDAEVLRLVAWEQLSIADVAEVLGIATNAVNQRLHRARRNLGNEYRRLESRQFSTPDAPQGGNR
jgi:RNA polymerase sigma factor (sigma-70 family)